MRIPSVDTALVWWPLLMRRLGLGVAVAALLFCMATPLVPSAARLVGDESKSPLEQEEEERESQEELLSMQAGSQPRQRLRAFHGARQEKSATIPAAEHRRRLCLAGSAKGHRLPNGHSAPLVC